MPTASPNELLLLRELVVTLRAALDQSQSLVAGLQKENALLRQKVDALARRIFGSSSEQVDPAQLELLLQVPASKPPEAASAPTPVPLPESSKRENATSTKTRAPRIPDHLPVIEQVIEPDEVMAAPQQWRCIGQETSEQLDYEPGRFLRRRLIRRKYVRLDDPDRGPIMAPLPAKLQERGLAATGLLVLVLISKYCDHLPLYRQEQIYWQRYRVNIPRQTLARWVELVAEWVKPIYHQIRTGVLGGGYVQVDETPVEYLAPGHGQTKQGYLWTCAVPKGDVFFQWETSRATECLDRLIPPGWTEIIQSDGYRVYSAFARKRQNVLLAACWAHVRRGFHEALDQSPRRAGWVLRQLQHLYRIEAELRENRSGPTLREAVRSQQSVPIVSRLKKALLSWKSHKRELPESAMGQAMDYALGQWEGLEVFLKKGQVEIDNNLVENAIRPTAVGKKNWLFVGEAGAGQRGAIIYTLIESCRRRGLDPVAYLKHVLDRLPKIKITEIAELTPAAWAKAQRVRPTHSIAPIAR